jgi:hypothetical protein
VWAILAGSDLLAGPCLLAGAAILSGLLVPQPWFEVAFLTRLVVAIAIIAWPVVPRPVIAIAVEAARTTIWLILRLIIAGVAAFAAIRSAIIPFPIGWTLTLLAIG